jgi:alpha-tubulin suppressor-like RCC1 family protein
MLVSGWTDIVAISLGAEHIVGLRSDGTVVATGANGWGQCNVSGWTDIVSISAGAYNTMGLRSDGTVVAVGNNVTMP